MISATQLRVKELLQERGWTTKMLAERTGMSESYLTHIKNCTRRWNEDILRRLADAFEIHPVDMFSVRRRTELDNTQAADTALPEISKGASKGTSKNMEPFMVPVVKEIPSHPSPYNNELTQVTSGCKGMFVPVVGIHDEDMFCYKVENSAFKPRFERHDYLVISPKTPIKNGNVVAVEYGDTNPVRTLMVVSFLEDFTVLEHINPARRKAPLVLQRGRDSYRIIGRVVYRYQKFE